MYIRRLEEGDTDNKHLEASRRKNYDFEGTVRMFEEFGVQQFTLTELYHS
jgi:hypothetical protein